MGDHAGEEVRRGVREKGRLGSCGCRYGERKGYALPDRSYYLSRLRRQFGGGASQIFLKAERKGIAFPLIIAAGPPRKLMIRILSASTLIFLVFTAFTSAQSRGPSVSTKPFIVKSKQEISDIYRAMEKEQGNKQADVVPAAGVQMRVAIFHDEKRENDLFEVHDSSDDIYYVLEGEATLALGGSLTGANEISLGEWRSKTAEGTKSVTIRKGDLVVVPRGTVHQRTVTGDGFSMILIKVFAEPVKPQ